MGHPIQAYIDSANSMMRSVRANYHLTLGSAIRNLKVFDQNLPVIFDWNGAAPNVAMSYRGYYCDLALDWKESKTEYITVEKMLLILEGVFNKELTGYKGGEYRMDENTPMWAAPYGQGNGRAILDIRAMQVDDHEALVVFITKAIEED